MRRAPQWIGIAAAAAMAPSLFGGVLTVNVGIFGGPFSCNSIDTCQGDPTAVATPTFVSAQASSSASLWGNAWVPAYQDYGPTASAYASAVDDLMFAGGSGAGYLFFVTSVGGGDWGSGQITYAAQPFWSSAPTITFPAGVWQFPSSITGAEVVPFTYGAPFAVTLTALASTDDGRSYGSAEIDGIAVLDSTFQQVGFFSFNSPSSATASADETLFVAAAAPEPATFFGTAVALAGLLLSMRKRRPA